MTTSITKPKLGSLPNPHIQARLQARIDKIRSSHSAFWIGGQLEDLIEPVENGSIEHIQRLRTIQRATGNFVKIVTGREIPVTYSSGNTSYTDGSHIVISADTDPAKLDSMVGTALHEAAHCLLSNESLAFLPILNRQFVTWMVNHPILQHANRLGIPLTNAQVTAQFGKEGDTVLDHVRMIMNVLEDRRIDLWMYQNAAGYRPYYEAMYNEYWHSPRIDEMLRSPEARMSAVHNYLLFVINMTNTNFDAQALPGLAEIRRIANLTETGLAARGDDDRGWKQFRTAATASTPDLTRFPKLFSDSVRILELIYEHSQTVESQVKPSEDGDEGEEGTGSAGSDLPNLDGGMPRRIKISAAELEKLLEKQKQFLDHGMTKIQLDANVAAQLEQLQSTNANVVEVEGDFLPRNVKAKVVVYRNVTKADVIKPTFPFAIYGGRVNDCMVHAVKDGKRIGAVLAHRIRVLQDERPITFNRQKHGKLDKRRIAHLGSGATDVFGFTVVERAKPANVWIDVDFSGSMSGAKSQNAMMVAVAIAYAAEKTRALNVTVAVRDGDDNCARVAILYDSRKTRFAQFVKLLPHVQPSGDTPEGLAFEAIKDEMMKTYNNERKFFINLSDGDPTYSFRYKNSAYSYGGTTAYQHTRRMMNEFRQAGINVLAYFIGPTADEYAPFRSMYGQDAAFITPNNIGDIVKTVNKLLMKP